MSKTPASVLATALLMLALTPGLQGQDGGGSTDSPYSVGLQSSWPAYGLSAKMEMNDKLAVQGVLGALGSLTTLSGRGYWYLERKEKYNWYSFGTVGMWRWGGSYLSDSETSIAFGGGAGLELDWRAIFDPEFPRLFSTIDLGLTMANFDTYQSWSLLGFGVGLHYHF